MPTIETTEFIEASPERVWQILTDIGSYPEWNPFIIEGTGQLRPGARLELKMQPPGGKTMAFRPTVLRVDPERELRWLGRLFVPGLFDGEHWFRLGVEGEGTRLQQGEQFSGLLPHFLGQTLARTEDGFKALNTALKERAEQL